MTILYGIKNCDTVKKARKWLDAHGVDYRFHDVRADGLDEVRLRGWVSELGWEALVNRRGTTWRQLPADVRESIDEAAAIALMLEHPALIKRPVLDLGERRVVGFSDQAYAGLFA
ncbi:MAG: ArsC family reductase [Gammaproteobacteria bacterium]|nr:ArsC family reductase [Gammaproteobacteria bacterium]